MLAARSASCSQTAPTTKASPHTVNTKPLQVTYDFEMCAMDVEQASSSVMCNPNQEGLVVHGMFLEGCGWDASTGMLCESQPKVRVLLLVLVCQVFFILKRLWLGCEHRHAAQKPTQIVYLPLCVRWKVRLAGNGL